jgi:hypothetical protein
MTTSAPQWPGQDEPDARRTTGGRPRTAPKADDEQPARDMAYDPAHRHEAIESPPAVRSTVVQLRPSAAPDPERRGQSAREGTERAVPDGRQRAGPRQHPPRLQVVPQITAPEAATARLVPQRRQAGRRTRFVVVRDAAERELWAARRRARARLPSPAAVTRDIALALLEVEAGCRSAAQLERIFSPELWEALEHRIGRRGGPLPCGRSLISVLCQENAPGLADTVAVVQKGELVRPVALRLDAGGGRWTVTELRWWRNETDTARTPSRDGGPP